MNFVIVANLFFPQCDAESFCSTRFASALARAGHHVHVVTMDYPKKVADEVYDALVDPRLKITRVRLREPKRGPILSRMRYLTYEWGSVDFGACIKATRQALKEVDSPILISRTHPLGSLIVAWHCRKYASKWIAHLSDPLPWFYWNSVCGRLRYHFERLWMKRAFSDANGISVTCEQVCRFFHDNFGALFDRQTTFVTTHIGDNKLKGNRKPWTEKLRGKIVAHPGTLYADRGAKAMVDAIATLNAEGIECTLALVGGGSQGQVSELAKCQHVLMLNDFDPVKALSLTDAADVLYVSDFESALSYSPRLMSKFVYQVYEDKPMVVRAPNVSAQHDYCIRYPNSGMFFADCSSQESLVEALRSALQCGQSKFDRTAIRSEFSESVIAAKFVENVMSLGKND